jgi:DNA-binding NarL/FixJ family response regulator
VSGRFFADPTPVPHREEANVMHSDGTGSRCARVLVVDGLPIFRDGLRRLLAAETDTTVCGEAGTLLDARRLTCELRPDLILLGADLPDGDPLNLLAETGGPAETPKVLVLTPNAEDGPEAVAAMRLGAAGVLSRGIAGEALVRTVRHVCAGGMLLNDALIERLVRRRG